MSLIYKTKFRPQGNMILIKDRHLPLIVTTFPTSIIGKYDTYKGSTQFTALQCIRFFSTREI